MSDAKVRYELRDDIAVVTMDDQKANALSPAMIGELDQAFDKAATEAKAVVLLGRPGKFSAGFDLRVMMAGPDSARDLVRSGGALFMKIYEYALPVVAGVTGHAIAGGVLLAACCDHRVGVRGEFKIGLNEVSAGMPVPILAQQLARDRLLATELTRATLLAHIYDPQGAAAAGWLDELAEAEALGDTAFLKAKELAKLPAKPFALTKRSLRERSIAYVRETLDANLESFGVL